MKLWICRDKYEWLTLHEERPFNNSGMWFSDNGSTYPYLRIFQGDLPEVTFENSPMEIELKLVKDLTDEDLFESSRKAIFETNAQSCEIWNQINEKSKEASLCGKCPNNKANNPNASGFCCCAAPCFANPIT